MDWHRRALDFLFPPRCVACRAPGRFLCQRCTPPRAETIDCPACHQPTRDGRIHTACQGRFPLNGLIVYGPYDSPLGAAVRALKYQGVRAAAAELGELLALAARDRLPPAIEALAPVPMHRTRQLERGFNQAELLARAVGRVLDLPVVPALERTRQTRPQVRLHADDRRINVAGAFTPAIRSLPRSIALVDDVATTGTTLGECAQALRSAGVVDVWGIVVARDR